jgi:hypothetical protein
LVLSDLVNDEEGMAKEGMIECLKDGIISFSKNDFDIFIDMFNKSI